MPCCFLRVEGNGPHALSRHMVGPQFGLLLPLKTGHTEMRRPTRPVESSSVLMVRSDFSSQIKEKTGTRRMKEREGEESTGERSESRRGQEQEEGSLERTETPAKSLGAPAQLDTRLQHALPL